MTSILNSEAKDEKFLYSMNIIFHKWSLSLSNPSNILLSYISIMQVNFTLKIHPFLLKTPYRRSIFFYCLYIHIPFYNFMKILQSLHFLDMGFNFIKVSFFHRRWKYFFKVIRMNFFINNKERKNENSNILYLHENNSYGKK